MWSNHLTDRHDYNASTMTASKRWLCMAAATILSACSPPAQELSPAPAARDITTPAGRLYVTNENSGDLTVIDTATRQVTATIPLGKRPRGIKVSPDGTLLYVALSGSPMAPPGTDESKLPPPDRTADGIGVVDVKLGKLLRVIQGGTDPEQTAISADGRRLFVANEDAGQASVIDVNDGRVIARVPVGGEPEGVELRPDGKRGVRDVRRGQPGRGDRCARPLKLITTFKAGPRPRSTGFLPDSSRAYVSAENGCVGYRRQHNRALLRKVIVSIKLGRRRFERPMGVDASAGWETRVRHDRPRPERRDYRQLDQQGDWAIEVGDRPWGIATRPTATRCSPQMGRPTMCRSWIFRRERSSRK